MDSTSDTPPTPAPAGPRRFERSSADRVVGGVAGGLGRYFDIDPTLVRIAFVALALLGGAGIVVYVAALLLVPLDDARAGPPASGRERAVAIGVVLVLVIAVLAVGGFGLFVGGAFFPLALLALGGLAVWWLVSGERPSGQAGAGDLVRRAALGVAVLSGCALLAVASFLAAGLGGGAVVAGLVIAAGAGLVAAAFVGGARWLVLPALAVALPLAFVSAVGIDLDGGFGERRERPATIGELQSSYRLGMGELVVDLRELDLPAGDRRLSVGTGVGHVVVLVRDDVCVTTRAKVGIGHIGVFDRHGGGLDVDWSDARRAPAGTARLVLDGEVGVGLLEVRHEESNIYGRWDRGPWLGGGPLEPRPPWIANDPVQRNTACASKA